MATSWRSTRSSTSLVADVRPSSRRTGARRAIPKRSVRRCRAAIQDERRANSSDRHDSPRPIGRCTDPAPDLFVVIERRDQLASRGAARCLAEPAVAFAPRDVSRDSRIPCPAAHGPSCSTQMNLRPGGRQAITHSSRTVVAPPPAAPKLSLALRYWGVDE
jgi:hypothetical protein